MSAVIDLTNRRFGNWLVLRKARSGKNGFSWICRCNCGKEVEILGHSLRKEHSKRCRDCFLASIRLEKGLSSKRRVYSKYRRKALKNNLIFNLSFEEFEKLTSLDCFYCGDKPNNYCVGNRAYGGFTYQGIDRMDNDKGYVLSNVVPCCKACNMAKKTTSFSEFVSWIKKLAFNKVWLKDKLAYLR